MAMAPSVNQPGIAEGSDAPADLRWFVFALFFIFGGITSLNDVIIPKLKELFTLNYTQAMLVQFCFFTAYLVIGIPGAKLVKKLGYMRGAVSGLGLVNIWIGVVEIINFKKTIHFFQSDGQEKEFEPTHLNPVVVPDNRPAGDSTPRE